MTGGDDALAVGAEDRRRDRAGVAGEPAQFLTRGCIPHTSSLVKARGNDALAVEG